MHFFTWLKLQTNRTDQVGDFAKWAVSLKKFPLSSDPNILNVFIVYNKPELYDAFATAYIEYALHPKSQVPKSFLIELENIAGKFFQ